MKHKRISLIIIVVLASAQACFAQPFKGNGKPQIAYSVESLILTALYKALAHANQLRLEWPGEDTAAEVIELIQDDDEEEYTHEGPEQEMNEAIGDIIERTGLSVEIELMVEQAESENPEERLEAVVSARELLSSSEVLADSQVIEVLEMILKLIKHDTTRARRLAICAIEDVFYHKQVPQQICVRLWEALINLTNDSDGEKENLAARALGTALAKGPAPRELENDVWEALLKLSPHEYYWCRDDAIKAIVTTLESTQPADETLRIKIWERLLSYISQNRCPREIKETALRTLANAFAHNPPPQEINTLLWETLLGLSRNKNYKVRIAARNSIEAALANNQVPELTNEAHWEQLFEILNENENNHGLRAAAARAIEHALTNSELLYTTPWKVLLALACDEHEDVQQAVYPAIKVAFFRYSDPFIPWQSIETIGWAIACPKTKPHIVSRLWNILISYRHHMHADVDVLQAVNKAIREGFAHDRYPELTDIETWRDLLDFINNENFALGQSIFSFIGGSYWRMTLWKPLIILASNEDDYIRKAAVKALASALAKNATTPEVYARLWGTLAACSDHCYPDVREAAANALKHMFSKEAARDTLTPELRDAVLNALIQLASDENASTREAAASALRNMSVHSQHLGSIDSRLLDIFLGLNNHEDESVRDAVRQEAQKPTRNQGE